jgi:hypothetical protein
MSRSASELASKTVISIYEASDAGLVQMVHGMVGIPFVACYPMTVVVVHARSQ